MSSQANRGWEKVLIRRRVPLPALFKGVQQAIEQGSKSSGLKIVKTLRGQLGCMVRTMAITVGVKLPDFDPNFDLAAIMNYWSEAVAKSYAESSGADYPSEMVLARTAAYEECSPYFALAEKYPKFFS